MPGYSQRPSRRRAGPGETEGPQLIEKLIGINRVTKVHKGGKRMSFDAVAIVGDGNGKVGMAIGKSIEAADAIRKGFAQAEVNMVKVSIQGHTIPHEIIGRFGASKVLLKPASPGTGIIAGGPVRSLCEACGIRDILTKSLGSNNSINLIKATLTGLQEIESREAIQARRRLIVEIAAE